MRKLLAILALLMACRSQLDIKVVDPDSPKHPAWVHDPKLAERAITTADVAASVWGVPPKELNGWTIVFLPGPIEEIDDYQVTGRANQDLKDKVFGTGTIFIDTAFTPWCVETSTLAHEVGHAVGIWGHSDPRWKDNLFWSQMAWTLAQVVPPDDVLCRNLLIAGVIAGH